MNKNSYNKIAQEWANTRNNSFVSELVIDFVKKVRPKGTILDIGCGTGYPLAKYMSEEKFSVTGIDVSENMIKIAESNESPNAEFLNYDFFDFSSTKKFDGILAWDSFFHFPKEKQKDIYSRTGSLLKSGGYLLFTHGNMDNEHIDKMMGESFYYSCLSKDKIYQLLNDNGFEIEYAYEDFIEMETHRSLVVLAKKK